MGRFLQVAGKMVVEFALFCDKFELAKKANVNFFGRLNASARLSKSESGFMSSCTL